MNESKDLGASAYATARIRAVQLSINERRRHLANLAIGETGGAWLVLVALDIRALEATLATLKEFV